MAHSLTRRALAWAAARVYAPGERLLGRRAGGFILAYHDMPAARFEAHVDALWPDRPVPLDDLVGRLRSGTDTAGLFAITFDDGAADTVREVSAVCLRRHWPVTFYLPTDYLDERHGMPFQWWRAMVPHLPSRVIPVAAPPGSLDLRTEAGRARFIANMEVAIHEKPWNEYAPLIEALSRYLVAERIVAEEVLAPPTPVSWGEVRELARAEEIRFESHGRSHTAVAALSDGELDRELLHSKRRISEQTGRECRHFCYPYGSPRSIGARAAQRVRELYDSGVTMTRGRCRGSPASLLPRVAIYERDDANMVRLKVLTA